MVTRADFLTGSNKKTEYYSDFATSFAKTPFGDQLSKVSNEKSINQSIKNLILTNQGERLFQPNIGSDIMTMLFEPNYRDYFDQIIMLVKNTIDVNEPRANLLDVQINSPVDEHTVEITLIYQVINKPDEISLTLVFKRVR